MNQPRISPAKREKEEKEKEEEEGKGKQGSRSCHQVGARSDYRILAEPDQVVPVVPQVVPVVPYLDSLPEVNFTGG